MELDKHLRAVLLVEGDSDRVAVETLAERLDLDLAAEGVSVVAMGGATPIGLFLERYGSEAPGLKLAGLYDAGEARVISRNLSRAGLGSDLTPRDMESRGFYMCVNDLEDELIRAVGMEVIEQVAGAAGDLRAFRTFQGQPAWRGRPFDRQFRRFLGAGSQRKIRYASLLVHAMDLDRLPRPLDSVLDYIRLRE